MKDVTPLDHSKTVATTTGLIVRRNPSRVWVQFVNKGANDVSLQLGSDATLLTGIFLKAGGGAFLLAMSVNPWYGDIHAIADSVASVVTCVEMEKTP